MPLARRLRVPISLAIMGVFFLAALFVLAKDSRRLLDYSFRLDPLLALLAFVVQSIGLMLAVAVWRRILHRFGGGLSYRDDLRIYCYSMVGVALPGSVWPMIGRAALYSRQRVSGLRVAAASVL
jgi:hypothetical protein